MASRIRSAIIAAAEGVVRWTGSGEGWRISAEATRVAAVVVPQLVGGRAAPLMRAALLTAAEALARKAESLARREADSRELIAISEIKRARPAQPATITRGEEGEAEMLHRWLGR